MEFYRVTKFTDTFMALVFAHKLVFGGMDGTGQYRASMEGQNHLMLEVADDTQVASNMRRYVVFPGGYLEEEMMCVRASFVVVVRKRCAVVRSK
jgi:hypothetical protein